MDAADLLKQLEQEAEDGEEIYEACWCETNDKEKTKSIADAEARISDLTTKIEELTANSARLNTEIKKLEKEVAENQAALDKATSIRQKELAEFNAEEKDLLGSISALKAAVTVLSKHHGGAFLQLPRSHVIGVAATLQHEFERHSALLEGVLTRSERRADGVNAALLCSTPWPVLDSHAPWIARSSSIFSGRRLTKLTRVPLELIAFIRSAS
jgi:vacuolar-type H+-ATPase subunit I/STV1